MLSYLSNKPGASLLISIVAFSSFVRVTDAQTIEKGKVTDTLFCLNQKRNSYSLYLPSGYNNKTLWPLIMIFDPSARGAPLSGNFQNSG